MSLRSLSEDIGPEAMAIIPEQARPLDALMMPGFGRSSSVPVTHMQERMRFQSGNTIRFIF